MKHGCGLPRIYRGKRNSDGTAYVATVLCGTDGALCFTCYGKALTDLRTDMRLGARPSERSNPLPRFKAEH